MGTSKFKVIYRMAFFLLVLCLVQLLYVHKNSPQYYVTVISLVVNVVVIAGSAILIRYEVKKEENKHRKKKE